MLNGQHYHLCVMGSLMCCRGWYTDQQRIHQCNEGQTPAWTKQGDVKCMPSTSRLAHIGILCVCIMSKAKDSGLMRLLESVWTCAKQAGPFG